MELQPKLSQSEIDRLRSRWANPLGRRVLEDILSIWRRDSRGWRPLISNLADAGVPPFHPEILTDLRGLELNRAQLRGVQIPYVDLSYSTLNGCDLSGACLQGSKLSWATFDSCKLNNGDLLQVMADHSRFYKCSMIKAVLGVGDFRSASFKGSGLALAMLDGADLTNTELEDAELTDVKAISTRFPDSFDMNRLKKKPRRPDSGFSPN